jgi:aspartyl-tRNA(Asn)/glutamyl-tRNA(Gln) amidotransferase subunit A
MLEAMDGVDALILPASAVPAPTLDEVAENAVRSDGRSIGGENIGPAFMMPCNVTGQPSCLVPIALSGDGLPIGLQVVGRPFADDVVLQVASLLAATSTEDFRPPRYR